MNYNHFNNCMWHANLHKTSCCKAPASLCWTCSVKNKHHLLNKAKLVAHVYGVINQSCGSGSAVIKPKYSHRQKGFSRRCDLISCSSEGIWTQLHFDIPLIVIFHHYYLLSCIAVIHANKAVFTPAVLQVCCSRGNHSKKCIFLNVQQFNLNKKWAISTWIFIKKQKKSQQINVYSINDMEKNKFKGLFPLVLRYLVRTQILSGGATCIHHLRQISDPRPRLQRPDTSLISMHVLWTWCELATVSVNRWCPYRVKLRRSRHPGATRPSTRSSLELVHAKKCLLQSLKI